MNRLTSVQEDGLHVEDQPLEYRNFEGTILQEEYGGEVIMRLN